MYCIDKQRVSSFVNNSFKFAINFTKFEENVKRKICQKDHYRL